jgi:hypothetical protein
LKFCDSVVLHKSGSKKGLVDESKCRPNVDSAVNDNVNDYFHIEGIEQFPENRLIIRVPGDTTKLDEFINYSNTSKGDRVFQGTRTDTTLHGAQRLRQLVSRKYEYVLELFKNSNHTKANRIDSIQGFFCIVRTLDFESEGCKAREKNDPLIK